LITLLAETRLIVPPEQVRPRALELLAALCSESAVRELRFALADVPQGVRAAIASFGAEEAA
jgi:hypothetical protein